MYQSEEGYLTLADSIEYEIPTIKGSRFIAFAAPIADDVESEILLKSIRLRYPDARHHCFAYQLLNQNKTRFSDDGEPSGSAGKPILAPIVGRQLVNTMIVVVRYFGGVKLGVGGLVRAYSLAANSALDEADKNSYILKVIPTVKLNLSYTYDLTSQVASALARLSLSEHDIVYTDYVESVLYVKKSELSEVSRLLTDYTAGKIQLKLVDS